jgi:septal ring factor EnvC (AmiA/AmiB activator)
VRRALANGILAFALGGIVMAVAPAQNDIKKHQAELESIRDQVRALEQKIKEQQRSEQQSLDLIDTYDRKGTLVRRLISRFKGEEQALQRRIEGTRASSADLEQRLSFLRDHYARYVASVYKAGRVHDLELLLSSRSLNQFSIRSEYLKRFTTQRKRDADEIGIKKREIEDVQARLQQQLSDERRLIAEKGAEEDRLASLVRERRDVLSRIRKDKKMLQRSIDRQRKAARELEDVITQMIEVDRIRKEREAEEVKKGRLPQPPATAGTFALKKGKLRWPVSQGTVVAHFGNQKHPTLKTITQNTGIDIAVRPGSAVTTVADGEVARIWWLPSYGNLMIVNHYNGYRTVYAHLADIKVNEGQKVKEGEAIAESGEALDGPRLHFEIWKDREKQNPEQWLARQ